MSTIEVKVVKVFESVAHPNADRLNITVLDDAAGWRSVTGRNQFQAGDLVLYIPPESLVTEDIRASLAENNITMKTNRLRAIKIRGVLSEGLCLNPADWLPADLIFDGSDVTKVLGITKYVPNIKTPNLMRAGKGVNLWYKNPNFPKFSDLNRLKKNPRMFSETPEVIATKKMHGCNARIGYATIPSANLSWWRRAWNWITRGTTIEFLVGSHNTIRKTGKTGKKRHPDAKDCVYWRMAKKYNLKQVLLPSAKLNPIIYAEIIGANIQKGYDYGLEEHEIRVFDIMLNGRYLPWDDVEFFCKMWKLPTVEVVYRGPWNMNVVKLAQNIDKYNGKKYNREGIVVKDVYERGKNPYRAKRTAAKIISPIYLADKKNSSWH